jgi:hypothetical protein
MESDETRMVKVADGRELEAVVKPFAQPRDKKASRGAGLSGGRRYWARISGPQLVESGQAFARTRTDARTSQPAKDAPDPGAEELVGDSGPPLAPSRLDLTRHAHVGGFPARALRDPFPVP